MCHNTRLAMRSLRACPHALVPGDKFGLATCFEEPINLVRDLDGGVVSGA